MKRIFAAAVFAAGLVLCAPPAGALSPETVENARWTRPIRSYGGFDPVLAKAQILLDRAFISPGVIDGVFGSNTRKALQAYQEQYGLSTTGELDQPTWQALVRNDPDPVLTTYTLRKEDVAGPFSKPIPLKLHEMALLPHLEYTSPRELLAEKFHMDEEFLGRLNPGTEVRNEGEVLIVARVRGRARAARVTAIEVDKTARAVRAFDEGGKLVGFYPATVGSDEFPSPTGTHKVTGVAERPVFTYSLRLEYARKKADLKEGEVLKVPPGPNNPVGLVWIGLNRRGYGIHGTPDPARISKTSSHGCVRLTNWDALELAGRVRPGVTVRFVD